MKLNDVITILDALKNSSKAKEPNYLVTADNKIDVEKMQECFDAMIEEARRSNDGVKAAGRRLRTSTTALSKNFLALRRTSI